MGEAITVIDRGSGEVVIEVRETFWDLFIPLLEFTLRILELFCIEAIVFLFILWPLALLLLYLLLLLHVLLSLLHRKLRISIRKDICEITINSCLQVAGLEFLHIIKRSKNYDCLKRSVSLKNQGMHDSTITIPTVDGEKFRIQVSTDIKTLQKIINKILLAEKSTSSTTSEDSCSSSTIVGLISAINTTNYSIDTNNNQLVFNRGSYQFIWHLLQGIFLAVVGTLLFRLGLYSISFILGIESLTELLIEIEGLWGLCLALLVASPIALTFRGVYIIVKQLITAVLRQVVRFDNISQVITLEEQFPIYKSTQKYFWEKAELSIEKPRNAKDYLEDKKVLVLTLQKAGHPAKGVELFKHENEQYLQQLRDYIGEFYREQDISDTIRQLGKKYG